MSRESRRFMHGSEAKQQCRCSRGVSRRRVLKGGIALGLAGGIPQVITRTPAAAFQGETQGAITIVLPAEPRTLENWQAYSFDAHPILRNIQEALLNRDPQTNELVGELATSWEQTDPLTWRFTLREGVTFHDGTPFDAEAAAFGLNYTWSPENNFEIRQFLGPELTATAVDPYTLDVTTADPDPILPARLYFSPLPSPTQIQEDPDSLTDAPIGTGPYQFVEWARGEHVNVTEFPDWWGNTATDSHGAASIKDATFVFREESSVRAAMVQTGEAQLARFLAPEECEACPQCAVAPSVETTFLRLDVMHPALADIRVRQAISHAIDREGVAEQIFGSGTPASQMVGPSADGYNAELAPVTYDLEQAQQLIAAAKADSVPVDMPLAVTTRQGVFLRNDELAQYIASQLKQIGLNAKTEVIEPAQFMEQFATERGAIPSERGWISLHIHGNELMDVSATAQAYYRCNGPQSTYCDPDLDAAIDKAIELTGDERTKAFQEVQRTFYDSFAYAPIVHVELDYGLSAELEWAPRLDGFVLLKEMQYSS
jgi:peptide/nickel transport system substrate-binding protein